jgi:hypothetical protein
VISTPQPAAEKGSLKVTYKTSLFDSSPDLLVSGGIRWRSCRLGAMVCRSKIGFGSLKWSAPGWVEALGPQLRASDTGLGIGRIAAVGGLARWGQKRDRWGSGTSHLSKEMRRALWLFDVEAGWSRVEYSWPGL